MRNLFHLFTVLFLVSALGVAYAQTNTTLQYQGSLFDSQGAPVTTNKTITFRLFNDAETGESGDALWTETLAVDIADGFFTVPLGSVNAFDESVFKETELWLELEIDSETLSPRQPVTAVPWARRAFSVEGKVEATSITSEGSVTVGGSEVINASGQWVGSTQMATDLNCSECVSSSEVDFNYADSASKGGPAASALTADSASDLSCLGCVSDTEVVFNVCAANENGDANYALNSDKLDNLDSTAFEAAGSSEAAVATHEANYSHLSPEQLQELAGSKVRSFQGDRVLGPNGSFQSYVHVFESVEPKVYLYLYGKSTASNSGYPTMPLGTIIAWDKSLNDATGDLPDGFVECNGQSISDPNSPLNGITIPNLNGDSENPKRFLRGGNTSGNFVGEDEHTLTIAELPPHSHSVGGSYSTNGSEQKIGNTTRGDSNNQPYSITSGSTGNGTPFNIVPSSYEVVWIIKIKEPQVSPTSIEIWIDGMNQTAELSDQNSMGASHYDSENNRWGTGSVWETGRLDLSNIISWDIGTHSIEFKETGGTGGRLIYFLYVVQAAPQSIAFANDTCQSPQEINISSGVATVGGSTEDMLGEHAAEDDLSPADCGGEGGGDVVYSVTLLERSSLEFNVNAPFSPRTYVLDSPCENESVIACGEDSISTGELEIGTYYFVVDSDAADQNGDFSFTVTSSSTPLPDNDSCSSSETLDVSSENASTSGTNEFAVNRYGGSCGGDVGSDVVYQFTLTETHDLTATLTPTFSAVMYLRANDCESGFVVTCSDTNTINLSGLGAGTYYLFVDGETALDEGTFDLSIQLD